MSVFLARLGVDQVIFSTLRFFLSHLIILICISVFGSTVSGSSSSVPRLPTRSTFHRRFRPNTCSGNVAVPPERKRFNSRTARRSNFGDMGTELLSGGLDWSTPLAHDGALAVNADNRLRSQRAECLSVRYRRRFNSARLRPWHPDYHFVEPPP